MTEQVIEDPKSADEHKRELAHEVDRLRAFAVVRGLNTIRVGRISRRLLFSRGWPGSAAR
jgi:hypothetical protein